METVEKSIDVNAPLSSVYNQWTQFEEFPQFMEHVEEVRQLDAKRLHWKAKVGGKTKEWDAEIFEQIPDKRIIWRSTSGAFNSGQVEFQPVDTGTTRIKLTLNYEPESVTEKIGDALGVVTRRIHSDLERFKTFIESRGTATGAWRGEIHGREVATGQPTEPRSKRLHGDEPPKM